MSQSSLFERPRERVFTGYHPMEVFRQIDSAPPLPLVDTSAPKTALCKAEVTVNTLAAHIEECVKCQRIILPSSDPANARF